MNLIRAAKLTPVMAALAVALVLTILRAGERDAAADGAGAGRPAAPSEEEVAAGASSSERLYPVEINPGPETPTVLARLDGQDRVARVACSTCHTTRAPDVSVRSAEALDEFHQGLTYRHGDLSCLSCHNSENYDTLRRADGSSLSYPDTMMLCAQCHGPQYRDYRNGSHGGMTGYWDLSRGPRRRNHCIDCHDAHAPAFPKVRPVFQPKDPGARQQLERAQQQTEHVDHE